MPVLVAIGAHHDDVELRCGGTLVRYVGEGWEVVYVVATTTPASVPWPEETGSGTFRSNQAIVEMRKEESRRAAAVLGVSDVNFLDFKSLYWYEPGTDRRRYFDGRGTSADDFRYLMDGLPGREFIVTAPFCPPAVQFLCDFLLGKKADVVLTHFPDDAHWEHYATALFVCKTVRRLADEGRQVELYAWEQGGAGNLTPSFAPTHFVDITDTIDLKCEALMCFVSQAADHDPTMFADRARKRAAQYGALVGMEYAEPFMPFQVPAHPQTDVHLPPDYETGKARRGLDT